MHGATARFARGDETVVSPTHTFNSDLDEAFIEAVVTRLRSEFALAPAYASEPVGGAIKRALDIVGAAVALTLLGPLLCLIALLIYAQDGGRAFYSQRRVGFRGRIFRCWKFRSMTENADERLAHYLAVCPAAAEEWARMQKLSHDPRVTPLGSFLRKTSLDELPQLFNVLVGDMSLVGPRPVLLPELERFGRSKRHYLRARPGLSGAWQVNGRSRTTYMRRVSLDRHYVARWSLWRDLAILAKTVPAMLRSNDAY